jgi:serine/threonine protein kinase
MAPEPGLLVGGDFRLVSPLREGGMGSVWVAEQLSVGRRRAVKLMRSEIAHDAKLRERFAREATIGSRIDSEHVVEVVAAGVDEALGLPWLAMELLDGSDLATHVVQRGAMAPVDVAEVVMQLCHALGAAHAAGIVHRDLKPENVFLARPRRAGAGPFDVKVLDFGLAGLSAEARLTSGSAAAGGTPLYVAPEQTEVASVPSPAMDVWALALVVYRMLTGRYFWRSAAAVHDVSITALLREIIFEPIPPATSRAAEDDVGDRVPPDFDAWFARCMQRDPHDRYRDAHAALAELMPVLATDTLRSVPVPPPRREPEATARVEAPAATRRETTPHGDGELEALLVDPAVRVGRASPGLLVVRWAETPDVGSVARLDAALVRAMRDRGSRRVAIMPVVEASKPQPGPGARAALARMMERHDAAIYAVAYVVLGTGFQAAALRGTITGLMLLARHTHPTKVSATVPLAIRWLTSRAQAAGEPAPGFEAAAAIERF